MKAGIIGIMVASALMIGCGNPSKEDVCGSCSDATTKSVCEAGYDACNDDGDCIEALEDTKICG
jgi:major membrane immunogen (membrane-anchored lipoprotein)